MPLKPAPFSTINSTGQCLLRSIELENTLPEGLFGDKLQAFGESTQILDLGELRACIVASVDLLKHRLLETAAAICRRHNSLLPIQRLPPEILSACIGHALADIETHNHQERLIQLSTVSSWWRKVTLNTPSLWGVIHSHDPDWIVSLALERSKDAPLIIMYEGNSYKKTPDGGETYRSSIRSDDFFKLVCPHMDRWRNATLPLPGSRGFITEWLNQNKVQISRHLRLLSLCWGKSPSTNNPFTCFSGIAERLLELKLCNLRVKPTDITDILAASHRMVGLKLESLVASGEQGKEALPDNDAHHSSIHLPCLTYLNLKWIPSSILRPVVQNLDPSTITTVIINHDMGIDQDQDIHPDPFASFLARLIPLERWVSVCPHSTQVAFGPHGVTSCRYSVELRGPLSAVLPWLNLHCLSQITQEYSVKLYISSDDMGDHLEQVVIDTLMRFPRVGNVKLLGSRESWRWMWLLSLPNAVQTGAEDSETHRGSWLWPNLKYLSVNGDCVNEFTVLSVLLARYGPQSTRASKTKKDGAPCPLEGLLMRPRENVWRAEVLDRIRELLGPGRFQWVIKTSS